MEDFIYKHIPKLGWLVNLVITLIFAWAFIKYPLDSFLDSAIRLYIFGFIWWLVFSLLDNYASNYRKRILFRHPEIKREYMKNKIEELDDLTKEDTSEDNDPLVEYTEEDIELADEIGNELVDNLNKNAKE